MRWLWSLIVWFLLTTVVIATAGLASGGDVRDESFETAPSRVGDRGVYKSALVVVEGGEGHWFDMNARYAFERTQDRWMDGPDGLRPARSFVAEWESEDFAFFLFDFIDLRFPSCFDELTGPGVQWESSDPGYWEDYGERWEDCGEEFEAWGERIGEQGEAWGEAYGESFASWSGTFYTAWDDPIHRVEAGGWHLTHTDNITHAPLAITRQARDPLLGGPAAQVLANGVAWTVPAREAGPCGFAHDMQGRPVDVWSPLVVHGTCPPAMEFGFARTLPMGDAVVVKVSGEDKVGDWKTTVFSHEEDPDALRLWFTSDVAYPVRILTRVDVVPPDWVQYANNGHPPRFYILHELTEYEAGDVAGDPGPQPAVAGLPGKRNIWGPSDAGFAHPWTLSAAWAMARDAPNSDLEAWLRGHPDAAVVDATYRYNTTPDPGHEPIEDVTWDLVVADQRDSLVLRAVRHTETTATAGGVTVRQPTYSFEGQEAPAGHLDASQQPKDVPAIPGAAARFQAMTGGVARGYEYHAICAVGCDAAALVVIGDRPAWGGKATRLMVFDERGAWRGTAAPASEYPTPRFSNDPWDPSRGEDSWDWRTASSGTWHWPEPKTAAGLTAATAFVSLLYFLWPVLKAAGVGMFSRIRHEDLLEHPVRHDMMELVQANPGIHFQELVRRLERGRGTTEHHVRKMVSAGLLVEKAAQGYTCYFPKGVVDRHLMAAAPSLKSVGARQVLQAIHQQPGTVAQALSERLGMAPSTVNYHLKKLAAAGLVETSRQGRFLALHSTPLGDQALGTFQT